MATQKDFIVKNGLQVKNGNIVTSDGSLNLVDQISGDTGQITISNGQLGDSFMRIGIIGGGTANSHIRTDSTLEFHIGQSATSTTPSVSIDTSGNITSTGVIKSSGSDSATSGQLLNLSGSSVNQTNSGTIRLTESSYDTSPFFQGGFIKYDGSNNQLKIGVHHASDNNLNNDTDVIRINRSTGNFQIVNSGLYISSTEVITTSRNLTNIGTISNSAFTIPNSIGSAGQVLKVPSTGTTLEWGADTGLITGITNFADNRLLTASGSTTINGESGLLFGHTTDGQRLDISLGGQSGSATGTGYIGNNSSVVGGNSNDFVISGTNQLVLGSQGYGRIYINGSTVNIPSGLHVAGTEVISSTRNLTNIGTISSGAITSTSSITAASGGNVIQLGTDGNIEITRTSGGAYIDFKDSSSEDYDQRIQANSTGHSFSGTISSGAITVSGSAGTLASFTNASDADLLIKAQSGITTLTPTTGTLAFGTSSTERMRITSDGRLGLGTDSPTVKLEIQENTNSTDVKLRLRSFNSSSAGRSTYIAYDPDTRIMGFGEGGDEVNIDQNGNLLVGKTSTNFAVAGTQLAYDGAIVATRSANPIVTLNRLSTDGEIQRFFKDGTQVGSIGVDSTDNLYIAGGSGSTKGIYFNDAGVIPATTGGGVVDNAVDLGQSGYRFKNLYLSGSTSTGDLKIGTTTVINGARSLTNIASANVGGNVTIDYTGNGTNDAGLFVQNDASDWGIRIHKLSTHTYGMQIDADGSHVFRTVNSSGVEKFRINGDGDIETVRNITSTGYINSSNVQINSNGIYLLNGDYRVGSTTVIDSSRNLTNIGTISNNNTITSSIGTNYVGLAISGSNSSYTAATIGNTGSGDAILYLDASNGDFAGSDYVSIRQNNALDMVLRTESSSGSIKFEPANSTALTLDTSQNATFAGNLYVANQIIHSGDTNTWISFETDTISLRTGGTDRVVINNSEMTTKDMNVGGTGNATVKVRHIEGKSPNSASYEALYLNYNSTYPVFIGHSGNQSDLYLSGALRIGSTAVIDYSRNLSNIGTISSGVLSVNGGTTNVVATFQSTDGIAGIKLQDSGGNVELSASGSTFRVQPSGGTPVLEVDSSGNTDIAGTISSGAISSSQNININASGTNNTSLEVGANTTASHYSYIDLIGDTTYSDYGLRIIRNNGGANTESFIYHRGTGNFNIETQDSAAIKLRTAGQTALTIDSSKDASFEGNVTTIGYLQHYNYLYSRNNLRVLNAAADGWHDWAVRSNGTFNLDVGTISSGAITSSGQLTSNGGGVNVNGGTGNAYVSIGSDTGNWIWKNYRASHHLALEDSDGTGEVLRVDTSGNILFGKTSTDAGATQGFEFRADLNDLLYLARAGNAITLNRLSSDGDIALFRKDGTTVGSIGTVAGRFYIGNDDTFITFKGSTDTIYPAIATGGPRDNAISLGDSGTRFKDLYLSGTTNVSGRHLTGQGGATTGYGFIGDGDSGMFQQASNQLQFSTANAERLRIIASGDTVIRSGNKLVLNRTDNAIGGEMNYVAGTGFVFNDANGDGTSFKIGTTTLMDLDANANLVLRNGTVTGQSGGFFGGDLEVYNSSDLIIGSGGTFKFGTTVIVDASRNLTNIGTINTSVAMGSSPTNIIYMAMSGNNTNGGGGAIRFDTSASNTDTTKFYASVEGIRSSTGDGSNELAFFTTKNGVNNAFPTRKMTIDEDGNLLVATTDTTLLNNTSGGGFSVSSNGFTQIAKQGVDSADPVLILNQTGVEGEILRFYKDGGIVGSIGSNSDALYISSPYGNDSGLRFVSGIIAPATTTGANRDAAIDLGYSSGRFKDLHLSGTAYTNGVTTTGNLIVGTEDNNSAVLEIKGGATGSTEGGEIRLGTAADHDGTYNFYRIDVYQDDFRIGRAGTTDITLDSSGRLIVGGTTAGETGATTIYPNGNITSGSITATGDGTFNFSKTETYNPIIVANDLDSDTGQYIAMQLNGSTYANIGIPETIGYHCYIASGNSSTTGYGLKFSDYIVKYAVPCRGDGSTVDNVMDLGSSSARFDDIYATNGTIQTSDRNEKQDIQALTDAEQRVATACKGLIRRFRWQDSVAEKDNNPDSDETARYHFGVMAQDLQSAFTAEGLDAGNYGMFISSTWTNDEGKEQTRLGVRYNELLAFIISTL